MKSPERAIQSMKKEPTTKQLEFEICFFAIGENFIRLKGDRGIYAVLRQLTFRCGMCGQPVEEGEMDRHANRHQAAIAEMKR